MRCTEQVVNLIACSQAWRKLALEKHPDKQPGNKQAAEEFIRLQTAYAILTDEKARAAWEGLQK